MREQTKVERTSISLSPELFSAAQHYAASEGRTFSGLIAILIRDHLVAHNALPTSTDAERQTVLDGLAEAYSIDELRGILSQRTVDQAVNTPTN
jgi:hypothetical protein